MSITSYPKREAAKTNCLTFNHCVTRIIARRRSEVINMDAGQISYEAYSVAVSGKDVRGNPLPAWSDVSQQVKDGWAAASAMTIEQYNTSPLVQLTLVEYTLRKQRPGDRTERDRLYAILLTDIQKAIAFYAYYLLPPF